MLMKFDLPQWCGGPKGYRLEMGYEEMIDT